MQASSRFKNLGRKGVRGVAKARGRTTEFMTSFFIAV